MMVTDNKWALVKDILFILVAFLLIWKGRFLGVIVGALAVWWYGRDFYYRIKALTASKKPKRDNVERPSGTVREVDPDDRIQVTDLSGAKEVDFEKE